MPKLYCIRGKMVLLFFALSMAIDWCDAGAKPRKVLFC